MDGGLLSTLKERMAWLGARQTVLARNVANANTPGFKPEDVAAFDPNALKPIAVGAKGEGDPTRRFETKHTGQIVSLEDEMARLAEVQLDYQLASTLYSKSLGLIKIAIGRK